MTGAIVLPVATIFQRLFGTGEVTPADLVERVERVERAFRLLEIEQATLHDQVRKWMRRAVAAERRNQDPATEPPGTPAAPPSRDLSALRPVERRRLMAALHDQARAQASQTNGNGEG